MNETYRGLERVYLASKRYPQFFDYQREDLDKAFELFQTGYCYPLSERDDEGRRIIFLQTRKWNPEVFSVYDATRLLTFVVTVLLEEEETQIAGIIFVFDHAGVTMRHAMSPADLIAFMDFSKNCSACRQKGTIIMNLPSFANVLLELFKSVLSEKLKKRLFLLRHTEDLKDHINPKLLPKEYGGVKPEAEMMEDFRKLRIERQAMLDKLLNYKVDWNKVAYDKIWSNGDENIGSFRKLEID